MKTISFIIMLSSITLIQDYLFKVNNSEETPIYSNTKEFMDGIVQSITAFNLQGTWIAITDNDNHISFQATGEYTLIGKYSNINNTSIFQAQINGSSVIVKQLYSDGRLYGTYTFDNISSSELKGTLKDYTGTYNVTWQKR